LIIYGPTPNKSSPWLSVGERVKIGSIGLKGTNKPIMLELGRKSQTGGRFIGMGHGAIKKDWNRQWWRMDYHGDHGVGTFDWDDSEYHFHTKGAANESN